MSEALTRVEPSMPGALPGLGTNPLGSSPLQDLYDQANALRFMEDAPSVERVCRAVDTVADLMAAGVILRVDTAQGAKLRRARLPARPGDVNVVVMMGPPMPAPNSPGTNNALRNELLAGGMACGSALLGWIGFVAGAALAVPTGGLSVAATIYDGVAAGAASINCLISGVRVLNEARGNHARNEQLDRNRAYNLTTQGLDAAGLFSVARGGADGVRALSSATRLAAAGTGGVTAITRTILLNREIKVQIVNTLGAVITAVSSNDTGVIGQITLGLSIPFTIVLSN